MRKNKVLAAICLIAIILQIFTVTTFANQSISEESSSEVPFVPVFKPGSYGEYLQLHSRAAVPNIKIPIDLHNYIDGTDNLQKANIEGRNDVLVSEETGYVEYEVNIPSTGLYSIGVNYYPIKGKGSAIEREIRINGELAYTEARSTSLDRVYRDKYLDTESFFFEDKAGNQMRPEQVEAPKWIDNSYFKDASNYYNGPLKFYLEKGVNRIRITSVREPAAYSELWLYGSQSEQSYDEFLMKNGSLDVGGNELITKIQAEIPSSKNDSMLFASFDRASPATEPASVNTIKLNVMGADGAGGARWKIPGQWVEYTVNCDEPGLYKIVMRARQNIVNGQFVSREITVNGETPFAEAANVHFPYSPDWQMITPKDAYNAPLLFKFNKGENVIRIKAVCGEMTDIINAVEAVVVKLNADYRKILMLTGPTPDVYRDYDFALEIPEVISDLKAQGDILKSIHDKLVNILGERGQQTAIIYNIYSDLYKMNERPDYIPKYFGTFKANITNLGSWLLSAREQPLELDYILVAQKDYKVPSAEKGFFSGIKHQTAMFFSSFFTDFNKISGTNAEVYDEKATVWYTGGRDQAQIMRQIIDRSFINQYKIDLNLELVPGGAILPSVLAGKGPDVAMGIDASTVINYASRNALQELDDFPGFQEIQKRFSPTAFVPTSLEKEKGKVLHYGLPETQGFSVLFYRKDILEEIGKEPPKTWDDVYDLIPVLQKRYMEFAPPDYNTLLYQNGGQLYKNGGQATDIDSEIGIESFIQYTDFFTSYKLPISYDFANRFRIGEMPVGLADYTFCNLLSVFAPEIRGLWSFTTVPGVMQEDGSINNVVLTGVSSSVMMSGAKNKENAWEFMKWWTDKDAQVDYGREIESILGAAARYNSANKEAVYNMPWKAEELEVLMEQWESLIGAPEMPGGYYLGRYLGFAFTNVVVDSKDPRETILDYVKLINDEIRYKRTELNLPLDD